MSEVLDRRSLGQGAAGPRLESDHPSPERGNEHLAVTKPSRALNAGNGVMDQAGDFKVIVRRGSVNAGGRRVGHDSQSMRIACQRWRLAICLDLG